MIAAGADRRGECQGSAAALTPSGEQGQRLGTARSSGVLFHSPFCSQPCPSPPTRLSMPKNTEGKTSLPPGKAPSHQRLGRGKLMGCGIGAEQVFGFSKGQVPWGGDTARSPALLLPGCAGAQHPPPASSRPFWDGSCVSAGRVIGSQGDRVAG